MLVQVLKRLVAGELEMELDVHVLLLKIVAW